MAEDLHYSSRSEHKRKFDDHGSAGSLSPAAPPSSRRASGFSSSISSAPSQAAAPPVYNSVPPPLDGIELAKQRAQEIAARIFSDAEAKRPRVENGSGTDDLSNRGFSSEKPISFQLGAATPSSLSSHGYPGSSKRIDIPNGRVGVIIGKSGETIKYLQVQSGARIQVTRDMDADPNSLTRPVELSGTPEQISKAEQLINDVLTEADAGGSGTIAARKFTDAPGSEHFSMKQADDVIPLHLPPGDTSTERTVHIDGTAEQIESAKQLVNDVISEAVQSKLFFETAGGTCNLDSFSYVKTVAMLKMPVVYIMTMMMQNRVRNPQSAGMYRPPRPPTSWVPPGVPPMQQPAYGYMQQGAYPGSQYNMPQPPYVGYPPQPSSGWDQSSNTSAQQTTQTAPYDYYNQQQQQQPVGGSSAPTDGSSYNYSQIPAAYNAQGSYADSTYSQSAVEQQQGYGPQAGYTQPTSNPPASYAQQGYGSASIYGNSAGSVQEGYTSQQPGTAPQTGYGVPPTSQPAYGSQPNGQTGYSQSAPLTQAGYAQPSQGQKPSPSQPVYGQGQQPPSQAGYSQPVQGYGQSAAQGYSQPPPATSGSGYGPGVSQTGYGPPQSYGAAGYSQLPYSTDGAHGSYDSAPSAAAATTSGLTKASPQS
ncbi:hypothetical protein AXF42_Ash014939 [Apostasia shenzhenica]|uniref:K Homology domain-containing protein n=1 Tax=Apostasia shenzhenica TaxID=1088818 RepID=A0A2I0ALV5_9ASPA|nr:hypothetical protein AXF42_Ash014939 [Apostasia shenzhenica]